MDASELKRHRVWIGLSQAELAHELGVAPNTIARWERAELPIGNARMLALALSTLTTTGFRLALADAEKKLPRIKVAFPDVRFQRRVQTAEHRLSAWIHETAVLPDGEIRRAITATSSFPGYQALRRIQQDRRLSSTTRASIAWATRSVFNALETASRIWETSWGDVTTQTAAKRKRHLAG